MNIKESVPLSTLTTFRVGGPVKFLASIDNVSDLPDVVTFAESQKLPLFLLGAGSNLLVGDSDLDAVAVKITEKGISYKNELKASETKADGTKSDSCLVVASAGEKWDDLVADVVAHGLGGIENLSFIPGTAGAAAVQNIGAYGIELAEVLEWVEVFDIRTKNFFRLSCEDCRFGYRMSIFKTPAGKNYIVTKIALRLTSFEKYSPNISYKDLNKYFFEAGVSQPTIEDVRRAVIVIRKRKLPDPELVPNAGSFFKNPVISRTLAEELLKKFPLLPTYPVHSVHSIHSEERVKVSAAWIIDHIAGLAGRGTDKVLTYENQSLVIVNRGGATASEIKNFADLVALIVKEKTKIILEREVEWIDNETIKKFSYPHSH